MYEDLESDGEVAWNAARKTPSDGRIGKLMQAQTNRLMSQRLSAYLVLATLVAILSLAVNINPAHATPATKCTFVAYSLNTGGGACMSHSFVQSTSEKAILAQKQALANEYAAVLAGKASSSQYQKDLQAFMAIHGGPTHTNAAFVNNVPAGVWLPRCVVDPDTGQCVTYRTVNLTQQSQTTTYYCGPAAASEILGVRGVSKSQSTLASTSYLHTDQNGGTNFGYMAPTLNTLTNSSFYTAVQGKTLNGTGFSTTTWENDMKADINTGWALAGNTVEYSTDSIRLVGHPQNLNTSQFNGAIYHWIAIYGYDNSGAQTWYADSISGDAWLFGSWASNVPAYASFDSGNMTTLLNRRGFIW